MRMIELSKITSDRFSDNDENEVATTTVIVNVDAIRCFYPRKGGRIGTRITFVDGGGFAVTQLYDEMKAQVTVQ